MKVREACTEEKIIIAAINSTLGEGGRQASSAIVVPPSVKEATKRGRKHYYQEADLLFERDNVRLKRVAHTQHKHSNMSCCCPAKQDTGSGSVKQYEDWKSGASAAPTTQSMKRGAANSVRQNDDTSDTRAVDWWRTRSQESSRISGVPITPERTSSSGNTQPLQLTPDAEYSWTQGGAPVQLDFRGGDRMATVESIEVDALGAVQDVNKQQHRGEIKDFLPMNMSPLRASSLPFERTPTGDSSGVSDESALRFQLVEHEEEDGLNRSALGVCSDDEEDASDDPVLSAVPRDKNDPRQYSHQAQPPIGANAGRLHELRNQKGNNTMDTSVDVDRDELDQIVLGVHKVAPRDIDLSRQEEAETNRVEDLLTGRRRKSPVNGRSVSAGQRRTVSSPSREPVSPKRSPTPQEAAAAVAAAASQIRTPSPQYRMSSDIDAIQKETDRGGIDSLSNVPSSVDPETRDRYLLACRLLKATMIEKDSRLLPEDKEFLRDLLMTAEKQKEPSDFDIAKIETASDLLSDSEDEILRPHHQPRFHVTSIKEAWQKKAQELFASRPASSPGVVLPSAPRASNIRPPSPPPYHVQPPPASPFVVLGKRPNAPPGVLTQPLMEALRGFFPYAKVDENFWLKYKLDEHGDTLQSLLNHVQNCSHTIIGVETKDGHVFGAYCSSAWKVQRSWFGSGECFLWRLKRSRLAGGGQQPTYEFDNEMEVYPYTGHDEQIQYCTERTLAVGGGDWSLSAGGADSNPHIDEPSGIGFMLDGDLMGGETNSCATFANPSLNGKEASNEFDVVNLEVWTLTPCLTVAEAIRLEERHAFIEQNTRRN